MEQSNQRVLAYQQATLIPADEWSQVSGGGGMAARPSQRGTTRLTGGSGHDVDAAVDVSYDLDL